MEIIKFVVFFLISQFFVLKIFRLTTYHRYFLPALPLLVGYSALVGWLLYKLGLYEFFIWQIAIVTATLFVIARRNSSQARIMLQSAGSDADRVRFIAESTAKTKQYFVYSSFVYIFVFSTAFLWIYNYHIK